MDVKIITINLLGIIKIDFARDRYPLRFIAPW
jgi:hypothetical protein